MKRKVIARTSDFPNDTRRLVECSGISIGIFNVDGRYYALRNRCPHQGAELCKGSLNGTHLPSEPGEYVYGRHREILRCPWHGWEFDITSGKAIVNPETCRVKTYPVSVETSDAMSPVVPPSVETFPVKVEEGWVVVYR
jgi:3-phenylpropionate/trans-cinnamate dioxygenase ferredoxin subunit